MNSQQSIPHQLSEAVLRSLALMISSEELPEGLAIPAQITLERPKNRDHGDYATSIALVLAKPSGLNPRKIAELLRSYLLADIEIKDSISQIDVAGPGFLNISLGHASQGNIIKTILEQGANYGALSLMAS